MAVIISHINSSFKFTNLSKPYININQFLRIVQILRNDKRKMLCFLLYAILFRKLEKINLITVLQPKLIAICKRYSL